MQGKHEVFALCREHNVPVVSVKDTPMLLDLSSSFACSAIIRGHTCGRVSYHFETDEKMRNLTASPQLYLYIL